MSTAGPATPHTDAAAACEKFSGGAKSLSAEHATNNAVSVDKRVRRIRNINFLEVSAQQYRCGQGLRRRGLGFGPCRGPHLDTYWRHFSTSTPLISSQSVIEPSPSSAIGITNGVSRAPKSGARNVVNEAMK